MKTIALTAQVFFYILLIQAASAQITVNGKVEDEIKKPLQYVVVSLHQGAIVVGNTITDSAGRYQFNHLKAGEYKFLFRFVSYNDTTLRAVIKEDTSIDVQLQSGKMLQSAQVTAKRPILQMEIDRLRFNVSGTDLAYGNNLWDVIGKTPLVNTSEDGAIRISGNSGAIVYVNNRKIMLAGNALKAYLSAIPADNVDAIEIMTTPSSKYDAEGGAGILNIITKKNTQDGFNGNASLSTRQTALNSQSGSLFLNGRTGKWDIYSDVYVVDKRREPTAIQDFYFPGSASDDVQNSDISTSGQTRTWSSGINLGIDRQLNRNNVIGLLFDYSGNWDNKSRNAVTHDQYLSSDSTTSSANTDKLNSNTYSFNLNYEGKLDSLGKKLALNFDALNYTSSYHSVNNTDVLDEATGKPLYNQDYFRSSSPQRVNNQSLKADFSWPFSKKISLDLGAKASASAINDNLVFEDYGAGGVWVENAALSNLFKYDENINAAYAILNHKINSIWAYQIGTRVENTIDRGYLDGVKVVDRNYTDVFPTGFLKFTPPHLGTYGLAVSSRITRPSYWDVNPFRTYTTDKTYFEGNPFLLPSRYYREELSHGWKGKSATYTVQLAASQTLNEFFSLPYQDSGNVVVYQKVNYGNKHSYTVAGIYYNQLRPWWQLSGTILAGHVSTQGSYASLTIDSRSYLVSISTNQTFSISPKHGLTCTVVANNTFPFTIVDTRVGNRLDTEIRFRKSAGAFNIVLSATDLFKSNKDNYNVHESDLLAVESFYYDTRSVALTVSYNFGKTTIRKNRSRATEFEAVKDRIM
ncbi:MAG TPA: outer membrane beta-barrel protein [Puia sp.]|nr:outer membrane beta-barrel protein [Puia sp.]